MSSRAVVVTPVPIPDALAAACVLAGVGAEVVPSEIGSIAVCLDPDGEVSYKAGVTISQLLKGALIVVLQNEDGQIAAKGFTNGAETEVQAAGLWLDAAPMVLEDLITGTADAADVEGMVSTVGMSRWRAARSLSKLSRAIRKRAKRG